MDILSSARADCAPGRGGTFQQVIKVASTSEELAAQAEALTQLVSFFQV